MFTGIVEETGEVDDLAPQPDGSTTRLRVRATTVTKDLATGDSVAVNGCCVTAVRFEPSGWFECDLTPQTLSRTVLGGLTRGSAVNLERPMRADGRFDGHLVQGHVDGTGRVLSQGKVAPGPDGPGGTILAVEVPPELAPYLVPKGSITVDGVSLTVVDVEDEPTPRFTVALIPATLRLTTLSQLAAGHHVNLEVDVVAKYVRRLLSTGQGGAAWTG